MFGVVRSLREAGMKVWMVTGDKTSTALQVSLRSHIASMQKHAQR